MAQMKVFSFLMFMTCAGLISASSSVATAKMSKKEVVQNEVEEDDGGYELDEQGQETLKILEQNGNEVDAMLQEQLKKEGLLDLFTPMTGEEIYTNPDMYNEIRRRSRCTPTSGRILMGCCGMYVRIYLDGKGLIPDGYRLGSAARNFGSPLQRAGFCNQKGRYNVHNAPLGAVLVYTGGPYGHVEIKLANGYYFGPVNKMPATEWRSKRRTLTGIYTKCR